MKIEINNKAGYAVSLKPLKTAAEKFARVNKLGGKELSIALIGGAEMKKLNRIYRGINQPTDILSFNGEGNFLGELVLDYDFIKKQAARSGKSPGDELIFVLIHGLLHLIGFDDKTEPGRKRMIKLGEDFIKKYL